MRSSPAHSERPLRVHTFRPRSRVDARWVRNATIASTLIGAGLGALTAAETPVKNGVVDRADGPSPRRYISYTFAGGAVGFGAGLGGSLLYALLGGPIGAVAGLAGAAALSFGGIRLGSRIRGVPSVLKSGAESALGYVPSTPLLYVPVRYEVKEDAPPPAPEWNGPWNDRVLFLGMNPTSVVTAVRQMKRHADVTPIKDSGLPDHVKINGKWMELGSSYGIAAFVKTLGLKPTNAAGVRRAISLCETGARDELGQLAQVWARGEKGARIPSRMVLAGHSNGDGVWGDDNGSLRLGPLLQLSRALPHASSQIEDAFVTGCYSGGEVTMDQYLLIFPRAKTIWAYDAQAPGVDNGATVDQGGWEEATRGRNSSYVPSKSASAGKYMAIWSATTGYHARKPPLNLEQLRGKVQWMDEHFATPAFKGEELAWDGYYRIPIRITDPHTGLVRQYYSWLVRLTQNKGLSEDERLVWTDKKQQTIRLLYFNATVAPRFARTYSKQISSGYHELGLPVPDFASLSRAGAVKAVDSYLARIDKMPHASANAQNLATLLQRGVKDLDPSVIPDGWV
ncbi:hypothetical protein IAD21_04976 [Abditibacteriota bacterium]|nr:hypothetical protein IAD21_04976 [Abditibacteriota bacterium]